VKIIGFYRWAPPILLGLVAILGLCVGSLIKLVSLIARSVFWVCGGHLNKTVYVKIGIRVLDSDPTLSPENAEARHYKGFVFFPLPDSGGSLTWLTSAVIEQTPGWNGDGYTFIGNRVVAVPGDDLYALFCESKLPDPGLLGVLGD
jgi:hypothetical protein